MLAKIQSSWFFFSSLDFMWAHTSLEIVAIIWIVLSLQIDGITEIQMIAFQVAQLWYQYLASVYLNQTG